ncbi:hypothetical protein V5F72_10685 [Xanthobacter flavus]|uniref:hypothetical protein n=1 Tax=Xanthobacter flavus TaxID=281 RepID=UPI003726F6F5
MKQPRNRLVGPQASGAWDALGSLLVLQNLAHKECLRALGFGLRSGSEPRCVRTTVMAVGDIVLETPGGRQSRGEVALGRATSGTGSGGGTAAFAERLIAVTLTAMQDAGAFGTPAVTGCTRSRSQGPFPTSSSSISAGLT